MAYEKRVCVLKQMKRGFSADGSALSGAVYCERLGSELTVTVRLAGLAPLRAGKYVLVLNVGGKTFCLDLGKGESLRIENAPSLAKGFSVLLCFVKQEAEAVAFGNCGLAPADYLPLLRALTKEGGAKKISNTQASPSSELPNSELPNEEVLPRDGATFQRDAVYDDEAIADVNYFLSEDGADEPSARGNETGKKAAAGGERADEDDATVHPFSFPKAKLTYYKKMRKDLEKAFLTHPKDTRLLGVFPQSEWVRTKGALLGVIYQNGTPRYLCVATEKQGEPPAEIKDNCTFVPTSPFSDEEGFYVVFQDADTGEYVTVSEN